jgi:hypothetical protein
MRTLKVVSKASATHLCLEPFRSLIDSEVGRVADIAGEVEVSLRAESETGFDKSKLQNVVLEPLREADLIE